MALNISLDISSQRRQTRKNVKESLNLSYLFFFEDSSSSENKNAEKIFKTPYFVNWSIKARGHAFSSGGRACNLCLTEKLIILTADQNTMLNRRDELLESCRHRRKHLLVSLFPPKKKEPPDTTVKQQGEPKRLF